MSGEQAGAAVEVLAQPKFGDEQGTVPELLLGTWRGRLGFPLHFTILGFGIWSRDIFFFPFGIAYLFYGLVRAAVMAQAEAGAHDAEDAEEGGTHVPFVVRGGRGGGRRRPPAAGE